MRKRNVNKHSQPAMMWVYQRQSAGSSGTNQTKEKVNMSQSIILLKHNTVLLYEWSERDRDKNWPMTHETALARWAWCKDARALPIPILVRVCVYYSFDFDFCVQKLFAMMRCGRVLIAHDQLQWKKHWMEQTASTCMTTKTTATIAATHEHRTSMAQGSSQTYETVAGDYGSVRVWRWQNNILI